MSRGARLDPFQRWREQQRAKPPPAPTSKLSPAREARRDLAIYAAVEAAFAGRPDAVELIEEMLRVDLRVKAEQAAELGVVPDTIDGCVAVLNVARRIVELAQAEA